MSNGEAVPLACDVNYDFPPTAGKELIFCPNKHESHLTQCSLIKRKGEFYFWHSHLKKKKDFVRNGNCTFMQKCGMSQCVKV